MSSSSFTCDTSNAVFTGLSVDTSTDDKLYVSIDADTNEWDEKTKAKVTFSVMGKTVCEEDIKYLCDYIDSGVSGDVGCGEKGSVTLDLSDFLAAEAGGSTVTTGTMNMVLTKTKIDVKFKVNGDYDTCTNGAYRHICVYGKPRQDDECCCCWSGRPRRIGCVCHETS